MLSHLIVVLSTIATFLAKDAADRQVNATLIVVGVLFLILDHLKGNTK